jgi:hypothetical protein
VSNCRLRMLAAIPLLTLAACDRGSLQIGAQIIRRLNECSWLVTDIPRSAHGRGQSTRAAVNVGSTCSLHRQERGLCKEEVPECPCTW